MTRSAGHTQSSACSVSNPCAASSAQARCSLDGGRPAWTGTGRGLHSQRSTPKAYTSAALVRMPSISSSGGMCVTVPAQAAGAGEFHPSCSLHTCSASLLRCMHGAWMQICLEGGNRCGPCSTDRTHKARRNRRYKQPPRGHRSCTHQMCRSQWPSESSEAVWITQNQPPWPQIPAGPCRWQPGVHCRPSSPVQEEFKLRG